MRVLLVSTYELGHQPLHLVSPATALSLAGHQIRAVDTAKETLGEVDLDWADRVAISVPMHTAMQLARRLHDKIRSRRPDLFIVYYGLYAAMAPKDDFTTFIEGEYEKALVASMASSEPISSIDLSVQSFVVPDRSAVPALDRYAHLQINGEHRLVGYVEASHGCRHRCTHCPIPAVYDGVFRVVAPPVVLEDIDRMVEAGAQHITFGDPDFLNGPAHSMRVLKEAHHRHPDLTFDATIKVEHLLKHQALLAEFAGLGVLFVVSAFETVDDRTLLLLDKGHTASDMDRAATLVRGLGLEIHPSWMPFTPLTTPDDILAIFEFMDDHDLFGVTDPVQMSIRMLFPLGSLAARVTEFAEHLGHYDPLALSHPWKSADPRSDDLQRRIAQLAEEFAAGVGGIEPTFTEMWAAALDMAGAAREVAQIRMGATEGRPRMTEPWFC